ncbi:MAG: hypothetical protein U1A22_09190 [Xanthomonadaceae bacterium]|nr:hypothetical protein [Xanthomonadaceae bacterium]
MATLFGVLIRRSLAVARTHNQEKKEMNRKNCTRENLKLYIRILALAAMVTISAVSLAQTDTKVFAYFANNTFVSENYDHTNVTHVWAGLSDPNVASAEIMRELSDAKSRGVKAIVSVESFLFDVGSGSVSDCPFRLRANAANLWSAFVDELLARQFLVPGDPSNSTVLAFYPVDEPELCGLKDQNGQAHPAILNAVSTIKNNPATANVIS